MGTEGDLTLSADVVEEGNTAYVYGEPDEHGPKYRARGTNTYQRKRLEDSVFRLSPDTPGTGVSPAVAGHVGQGNYRARMQMAAIF